MTKSSKGHYVDGYVLAVPKKNLNQYRKMAQKAGKVWRKYGALDYKESVGEDLKTPWGVSFSRVMKLKPGEVVIFSYIVFKSRTHRDRVNKKAMKELMEEHEKSTHANEPMPFDMKRMVYGGFKTLVDV